MLLIDGMLLAHRCYAKMDFLKNSSGRHTGMEYGFLKSLESVKKKLEDDEIFICWDSRDNFRKRLDPMYKANRNSHPEFPWERLEEFKCQLRYLYPNCLANNCEADDVMASIASAYRKQRDRIYIYSNDKDLLQVVWGNVYLITSKDSNLWLWDDEEVLKEFGVLADDFMLLKAMFGDKSDNIPGVGRIRRQVVIDKLKKGTTIKEKINLLFTSDGYSKKEVDKLLEFGFKRFILNVDLVKLKHLDYWKTFKFRGSIQPYLDKLEIRSLNYEF